MSYSYRKSFSRTYRGKGSKLILSQLYRSRYLFSMFIISFPSENEQATVSGIKIWSPPLQLHNHYTKGYVNKYILKLTQN